MFGLSHQIGRDDIRVGRLISQAQTVRRACEHVDAHPPEQNALGLGNELVSRAYEDVGCRLAEKTLCWKQLTGSSCNTFPRTKNIGS